MRRPVARDPARRWVLPTSLGVVVLLGAVVWLGNSIERRTPTAPVSDPDAPRLRYDDLYQVAFRSDGGTANVTVDAVYEHAELEAALEAYVQRGLVQSQVQTQLANVQANDATLAFIVTVTTPPGYAGGEGFTLAGYRPKEHATLTDDRGRSYPVRDWSDIVDPASTDARSGMLTFDRTVDGSTPESVNARTLRLELTSIPGGTRSFAWNLALLGS